MEFYRLDRWILMLFVSCLMTLSPRISRHDGSLNII